MSALAQALYLTEDDFYYFQKKIYHMAGISLSPAKVDLVQARLRARVIELGYSSYHDYSEYLDSLTEKDPEWEVFINCLTTNKTEWFRESNHFQFLIHDFLPCWKKLGKKHLRIWCAASSTGEEPYTIALVLTEAFKDTAFTFEVIASDIDTKVLKVAKNGVYRLEQRDQIPEKYAPYIALGTNEISQWFKIKSSIKKNVVFKRINLMNIEFDIEAGFDLIFCRNVLIYFNAETIKNVIRKMHSLTATDGCLIISHSESLQNIDTPWKYLKPSIYGKGKFCQWITNKKT